MITLFLVGELDGLILVSLVKPLENTFNQIVQTGPSLKLPEDSWNQKRQQYPADSILDSIPTPPPGDRYLGILDADIFAFGLDFVFGEADADVKKSLISVWRLRQEFYGLPPDEDLFKIRTIIEAVHELGHTNGLRHCPNPHCVMHFSNSIYDTDKKGWKFCSVCLRRLNTNK